MGDVALVAPGIQSVLKNYPDVEIIFVTRPLFSHFFQSHERLTVVPVNLDKYKGLFGLKKLQKELLNTYKPDVICDLHDVLRTNILNTFFKLSGNKVFKIDKERRQKKKLISSNDKSTTLKHAVHRYLEVFKNAGYDTNLVNGPWLIPSANIDAYLSTNNLEKKQFWIGIAPFAKHETKVWGIDKINELLQFLSQQKVKVFMFGGGKEEMDQLNDLKKSHPFIYLPSNELKLDQELTLISKLDQIITMDSSNMHMASLVGTPSISIWGSTHPVMGFKPIGDNNVVLHSEIACSPCSVFGNKPCYRGDHACMKQITITDVSGKITFVN